MRRFTSVIFVLSILFFAFSTIPAAADIFSVRVIHVSPNGNDLASGTSKQPFATLQRAQQEVRRCKAKGNLPNEIRVFLHEGTFRLSKPLQFTHEDSGTQACPITWQAAPNAKVLISGGRRIESWKKYNEHLYVADVSGFATETFFPGDFHVDGNRAFLARTPNFGSYFYTKKVLSEKTPDGPCHGFKYDMKDIGDWISEPGLRVMLYQHWSNSLNKIKSIDRKSGEIRFERTLGRYVPSPATRYYVVNFFAALDAPGEWYYDRSKQKLFYYPRPGEDMTKVNAVASCVQTSLIEVKGDYSAGKPVQYLAFENLSFENTRPNFADDYPHSVQGANTQIGAFAAVGMEHCRIENCVFAHLGEHGISLWDGCHHNVVKHNRVYDLGGGGVYLSKESPKSTSDAFMTSYNTVENNFIHDCGYHYAAACGVFMAGCSCYNKVLHNEICNTYYTGIHAGWSWSGTDKAYTHHNEFGFNHIHHIGCGVMSDLGGVYFLGISTGTEFHDNHIHHISRFRRGNEGYGGWGVYFDAGSSRIHVWNNVVHDTYDGGLHLHCYAYPRGDVIENNIFAFSDNGQLIRNATMEPDTELHAKLSRNIIYDSTNILYYGGNWRKDSKFSTDYNCLWTTSAEAPVFSGRTFEAWQKDGNDTHSIYKDPLFVDAAKRDLRLKENSPAFALGFKQIDMSKIGLYGDAPWVALPKSVQPRATEIAVKPPFTGIHDSYEEYGVGETPEYSHAFEEGEAGTVRVVAQEGVNGSQCLKFTDAPNLKWQHDPHLVYQHMYPEGKIAMSCQLRFEPGSLLDYQWRDYDGSSYVTGPTFSVSSKGVLSVGGKKLLDLPPSQWIKFDVECQNGAKANGLWSLSVTLPGKAPQVFNNLSCEPKFKNLTWVGFISVANDTAVFYLDDFDIRLKK